jgi:hypothetical protein
LAITSGRVLRGESAENATQGRTLRLAQGLRPRSGNIECDLGVEVSDVEVARRLGTGRICSREGAGVETGGPELTAVLQRDPAGDEGLQLLL